MRVMVVGAGLVGLSIAYALTKHDDVQVDVIEQGGRVGGGASRGNAGWICPTQVAPLAAPGLVRRLTRDALSPSSALYIRPGGLPALAPFLLRLASGATTGTYRERVAALRVLADRAWPALEEAVGDGLDVELHRTGILSVFADPAIARHALDLLAFQAELLTADEMGESCLTSRATTGYVLREDGFVDPAALVEALAAAVRERGGQITVGREPDAISRNEADCVVLAAGAATAQVAAQYGHRLRVVPGKGYSFTVPMRTPPSRPVHLEQAHVVLTPLDAGVRVAGTMELGDRTNRLDQRRVEAIAAAAAPWVEGIDWDRRTDVWVGERPLTSNGLPIIGRLEDGLFVATGHGMYGVTLALPTGDALAREIVGSSGRIDLSAFAPTGRQ
jgi:D-amino-acid dehydrogenase